MSSIGGRDDQHEDAANYNFDHPEALDFDLAFEKLNELLAGQDVEIPTYDFALHKRTNITSTVKSAPIIMFEGIHAIQESRFREIMDLKLFVLTPDDIRLARRSKYCTFSPINSKSYFFFKLRETLLSAVAPWSTYWPNTTDL